MIGIKAINYIKAYFQKIFLFLIYGRNLVVGKHTTWRRGFVVMMNNQSKVIIGDNCFFNNNCTIDATNSIFIGEGTIFGENVKIYDHNHRFADSNLSIKDQGFSNGSVYIGKHCWIGSNVVILKGSRVGDNCVIGAGCIISGDIPGGHIVRINTKQDLIKIDPFHKNNKESAK